MTESLAKVLFTVLDKIIINVFNGSVAIAFFMSYTEDVIIQSEV